MSRLVEPSTAVTLGRSGERARHRCKYPSGRAFPHRAETSLKSWLMLQGYDHRRDHVPRCCDIVRRLAGQTERVQPGDQDDVISRLLRPLKYSTTSFALPPETFGRNLQTGGGSHLRNNIEQHQLLVATGLMVKAVVMSSDVEHSRATSRTIADRLIAGPGWLLRSSKARRRWVPHWLLWLAAIPRRAGVPVVHDRARGLALAHRRAPCACRVPDSAQGCSSRVQVLGPPELRFVEGRRS